MKTFSIIIGIIMMTILITLIVIRNEVDVFNITFEDGSSRTFTQTELDYWYNANN